MNSKDTFLFKTTHLVFFSTVVLKDSCGWFVWNLLSSANIFSFPYHFSLFTTTVSDGNTGQCHLKTNFFFSNLDLWMGKSKHQKSISRCNLCNFEEYKLFMSFKFLALKLQGCFLYELLHCWWSEHRYAAKVALTELKQANWTTQGKYDDI